MRDLPRGLLEMSKSTGLSYNIGYLIKEKLFCPVCPDLQVLSVPTYEVYLQRPHYEIPRLQRSSCSLCSPQFVLIIKIICIDPITIYLGCNVPPIFHINSSSVSDWCSLPFLFVT